MKITPILLIVAFAVGCLAGCSGKDKPVMYHVDYSGDKGGFSNAEDEYAAGTQVELYYDMIATDTDYTFFIDGEYAKMDYSEDKGYIMRFTMPEHDVVIHVESRNSMEYVPQFKPDLMILKYEERSVAIDGPEDSLVITVRSYDQETVRMTVRRTDEGVKSEQVYIVPADVVQECYNYVYEYEFSNWEELEDCDSLEGAYAGFTYAQNPYMMYDYDDPSYIPYTTVSTGHFPPDGQKQLNDVRKTLMGYAKDEYKAN
ncbi:MAG: hypothetical protein IJH91_06480 [Mogibacterium sp.]|nr:hypothetical protein [Mogibacterium sp.]